MIHWHKWVEEERRNMMISQMRVPHLIATNEDYDAAKWPDEPWTLFLFRCSKCQDVKVTEEKGHWAQ